MQNNQDLLKLIEELKNEIKKLKSRKKYGLVWEEKEEQVVLDCQNKLPILKEVKNKEIKTDKDKPVNILIEGDNYHSLSVLSYTHKEKVDVIYIDPPYNTGNKSWKYNNDYVEKDDNYRHSKWLSFMAKRLRLAKKLLAKTGIICCTIDDYEVATLTSLMDEIFGENNKVGTLIVESNPRGRTTNNFFATCHEYYLIYAKNALFAKVNDFLLTDEQKNAFKHQDGNSQYRLLPFRRSGGLSTPSERPNSEFSIFYNLKLKKIEAVGGTRLKPYPNEYITDYVYAIVDNKIKKIDYQIYLKNNKDVFAIMPIDTSGKRRVWRWSEREKILQASLDGDFEVTKSGSNFSILLKDRIKSGRKPKTIWINPKYDASSNGTVLIDKLLKTHKVFDYPKSIYAVKDFLKVVENSSKKDNIFLDFFAGSGTTGHAVSILNKEDSGSRKFILCTNNENEISENVCYPRIKAVINGISSFKDITGIKSNLKYFKTDFVDTDHISKISDDSKIKLTYQVGEMIALRENILDEAEKNEWWQIFANDKKILAIYFKEDKSKLQKLVSKLNKENKKVILYIFSWGKNEYKNEFSDYKNIRVEDIPEPILEVYKEINKL